MHLTTEQECLAFGLYIVAVRLSCYYGNTCLAFGLYIVAVRLSCTSEARATQWRILVQVAELVWAEIPGVSELFGFHPDCDVTIRVKSKQLAYRPIF